MWTEPDDPLREDPKYGGHNILLTRRFDVASNLDDPWIEYISNEFYGVFPYSCSY